MLHIEIMFQVKLLELRKADLRGRNNSMFTHC